MSGIPNTTDALVYEILETPKTVHEIIQQILGESFRTQISLFLWGVWRGGGKIMNGLQLTLITDIQSEGTNLEAIRAQSPIFLMVKPNAREQGRELHGLAHGLGSPGALLYHRIPSL